MFVPDLTNCDKEPIHIPGKIQSHGFLIATDAAFSITYCSENVSNYLPVTANEILGQYLGRLEQYIIKADHPDFLAQLIRLGNTPQGYEPNNPYLIKIGEQLFNLIVGKSGNYYMLEFEPEFSDLKSDLQRVIGSSLSEMLADKNLSQLLFKTAQQVKRIIGYDRVMIYKFHEDGHGEVVAEAKNEALENWLGLHYPASDIPKQARELYKVNLIRLISDVNQEPAPILTISDHDTDPLDLTNSVLRAVSPIHIQYLKNMGVASSFSISLLSDGELWGLIACHNYTPRFINYKDREAAKLVGQVLSSALSFRQHEDNQHKSTRLKDSVDTLSRHLSRNNNVEESLLSHEITLKDAVDAAGAALIYDNQLNITGNSPDEAFVLNLVKWLNTHMEGDIFSTNSLPGVYEPARLVKDKACGLLACRLSKDLREYMLWFRPEVIATVKWAGNPEKPAIADGNGLMQISPRTSFEVWSQQVQDTSLSWSKQDIRSALLLKDEVNYTISRKANELRKLNEKLREAYEELDAFSYTISHDLKNPLTTIKSYSQLLNGKFNLEPKAQYMVERILSGAEKMQEMIHEVLNYSKVGQSKISATPIDMDQMLHDLKHDLLVASDNPELRIEIGDTPDINGDNTMVFQVFSNLLSNAVKYSKKSESPFVTVKGEQKPSFVQYSITDNGIGIQPHEQDRIFGLFSRSDEVRDYEGSGVGLAIVKKILEKHQGRIWVESAPGQGSTFNVTFQKSDVEPALN